MAQKLEEITWKIQLMAQKESERHHMENPDDGTEKHHIENPEYPPQKRKKRKQKKEAKE